MRAEARAGDREEHAPIGLNFLGLGFSFGAKDGGLTQQQNLVSRGFTQIKDSMVSLADGSAFSRMGESLQSMAQHVANATHQIHSLNDGVNLTTAYEGHMQALSTEARSLGANMGYTGAQLGRFTSRAAGLADGLNTSAQNAAQALDAMARGGEGLRIVGLRSQADAVRFQATIGNLQELSGTIHQLRTEFHMTDDQVRQVIGSTTAMGRATGNVSAAYQGLGEVMGLVRQQAALQGAELDSSQLSEYTSQVQALSSTFYSVTHNAEEARRMALDVFRHQLDARGNWQEMFAGTSQDVSQFVEHLAIAQGDVGAAFDHMRQGPMEFARDIISGFRRARQAGTVTEEGFNFYARQLEQALGPEASRVLVNAMRSNDDALLTNALNVQNATADLGRMAREAHSTGRTLQQEFERIQETSTAAFRGIARGEARRFVSDFAAEFRRFNHDVQEVASGDGPLAAVARRMSLIHQIGALALIPQTLRPMASLFSSLATQMAPAITALGSMGFRLSSLTNPYVLLATAAGLLAVEFYRLYRLTGSVEGAFSALGTELTSFGKRAWDSTVAAVSRALNWLEGLTDRARTAAEHFDWAAFFTTWINRAVAFVRGAGGGMGDLARTIFSELQAVLTGGQAQTQLGRIASNVVHVLMAALGGLGAAAAGVDWSSVSDFLARGLSSALFGAFNLLTMLPIGPMMEGLFQLIERGLHLLGSEGASNLLSGLVTALGQQAGRIAGVLLDMLHGAVAFLQGGAIQSSIGPILNVITNAVGSIISALIPLIGNVVGELPTMLHGLVDAIAGLDVGGLLEGLLHNALDLADRALQGLIPIVVHLVQQLPGLLDHAATVVLEVVAGLPDRIANLFDHAGDRLGPLLQQLFAGLLPAVGDLLVRAMGLIWRTLTDYLPRFVSGLGRMFMSLVNGLGNVLIGLVNGIRDWLIGVFPRAAPVIMAVFGAITTTIRGIMGAVGLAGRIISEFIALFLRGFRAAWDGFRMFWDGFMEGNRAIMGIAREAWGVIVEAAGAAASWISQRWDTFSGWFSGLWTRIKTWGEEALTAILSKAASIVSAMQERWEALSGFVSGLWTRIRTSVSESVDRMVGYITNFKDRFMEALNGIWDRVMHLFGNSVHDVVGDDLRQTNAVSSQWSTTFQQHANQAFDGATNASSQFGAAAQQVVNLISQRLTGALATSLTAAFSRSFAQILRDLDAFKRLFTASFERFTVTLRDKVLEAMQAGQRALQESIRLMETSLDGVARRLSAVLATATTTSAAIQAVSPGPGGPNGPTPAPTIRPLDHAATLEDVRQAIHDPQWYRQYVALYEAKMTQLILAVERSGRGGGPQGGRRPQTSTGTEETVDRVAPAVQGGG